MALRKEKGRFEIFIINDYSLVRFGIKQILSETKDIILSGEASISPEAAKRVIKGDFDAVLLDVSWPERNGLEILRELKGKKPKLPVLVLSSHPDDHLAVRVLKSGAAGFLTTESAPEEILKAIRQVAQGRKYINSALGEKLASYLDLSSDKPAHEILSLKEYQVLCLLASGKRLNDAAIQMNLSPKIINTYHAKILEKMNLRNNSEMIRYAIENKLVF